MKPRRRVVFAVLAIGVVVALAVAADLVVRSVLTTAITETVRQRSGAERAEVELHTVSALWSVATSRLAGVDVDLVRPERDGYEVDEVVLELKSVSYSAASGSSPSTLSGRSGTAVLRITEGQLDAAVTRSGLPAEVDLVQNGVEVTTELPRIGAVTATASIDVRDGALLLDLSEVSARGMTVQVPSALPELRIPLPTVPPDTRLEAYFVVGGRLEVRVVFGEFEVVDGEFRAGAAHEPGLDAASMLASV